MVAIPFDHLPATRSTDPVSRAPSPAHSAATEPERFDEHLRRPEEPRANSREVDEPTQPEQTTAQDNTPTEAEETTAATDHAASDDVQPKKRDEEQNESAGPAPAASAPVVIASQEVIEVAEVVQTPDAEAAEPAQAETQTARPSAEGVPLLEVEPPELPVTTQGEAEPQPAKPTREQLQVELPEPRGEAAGDQPKVHKRPQAVIESAVDQSAPQADQAALPPETGRTRAQRNQKEVKAAGEPSAAAPVQLAEDTATAVERSPSDRKEAKPVEARRDGENARPSEGQPDAKASGPASRLPEHLLGHSPARRSGRMMHSQVDQTRFLQRVVRAFEAARHRAGPVRLRLSPPELGSLRLEIRLQSGAMVARVETDTHHARTILLENLPLLRERLADQGVRVERFEVDVPDRQPGNLPDAPQDQQQRGGPPLQRPLSADEAGADSSTQIRPLPLITPGDNSQLNVIV